MKSYPNSPLNYHLDDSYMPRSASRSSCSSTKTSVSKSSAFKSCARLICQLFSDKIGLFILFKVLCCFFISLANFAFNEKLAGLTASKFANSTFDNLLFPEISCWILPLIVYLVWSKSFLINLVTLNPTLFMCSIISFLVSVGSPWAKDKNQDTAKITIAFLWVARVFFCALLSLAYWINFFDLLLLFASKHLIPVGIYFSVTTFAALISHCFEGLQPTYLTCGCFFLVLIFLNRFKRSKIGRVRFSDEEDFPLMSVAFRGIRTSLAFFELVMMASLLVLNIACFLSPVDLKRHRSTQFEKFSHGVSTLFHKEPGAVSSNFCTIGLLLGFFVITIVALIRFKKLYLSYMAKLILMFYNLNFILNSSSSRTSPQYLEILLFFALAVNFCVKLNDIIRGFKRFLHLSDMAIRLDFLYLKAFDLLVVSLFTGFAFGASMIVFLTLIEPNDVRHLKPFAEFICLLFMAWGSFESLEHDHFLIIRDEKPPEVREEFVGNNMIGNNMNANMINRSALMHPDPAKLPLQTVQEKQFGHRSGRGQTNISFDQKCTMNENAFGTNHGRMRMQDHKNENSFAGLSLMSGTSAFGSAPTDTQWSSFANAPSAPSPPGHRSNIHDRAAKSSFASGGSMFAENRDYSPSKFSRGHNFPSNEGNNFAPTFGESTANEMFGSRENNKSPDNDDPSQGKYYSGRQGGQRSGRRNRERSSQNSTPPPPPQAATFPAGDNDEWGDVD